MSLKRPKSPKADQASQGTALAIRQILGSRDSLPTETPGLIALLDSKDLQKRISEIPPETFDLTETELKKRLKAPTPELSRLRMVFWDEYSQAVDQQRQISTPALYRGIMPKRAFEAITDLELAYVLTPPTNYVVAMQELMDLSTSRLREIMTTPFIKKITKTKTLEDGTKVEETTEQVDTAAMDLVFKIATRIEDRMLGAIATRHEHLNLHISNKFPSGQDLGSIEAEIQAIEVEATGAEEIKDGDDKP